MIFSKVHNCVVYKHPAPDQVCAAIHGARRINGEHVAVPATLFSLQLARVLGLPVPPLLDLMGYDWPMQPGRQPYAHQRYMASFMALHPRSFNLSEMGTGKTLAALWAADYLMRQGAVRKALILSPLSTLKRVWDDEIFRNFCGRRQVSILYGSREERLAKLQRDVDFYVINHDGLTVGTKRTHREMLIGPVAQAVQARDDIDLVIVDEASAYKDATTERTKVLLRTIATKPYVWLMSGTPTPNAPTDAFALAKLAGNLPGESFRAFQGKTMTPMGPFKWLPRANASEVVRKALSPAVRFSREECIDLPECVVETRDVELSPAQDKAYKELRKNLQAMIGTGMVTAINEASLRIKLLQIECGAVYGPNREINRVDAADRLRVLKEVIDESGAKVIVFAPFTSSVDLLHHALREHYGETTVARVYGATTQGKRNEIFRKFESEAQPRIIVADPGTMSHGLTLVAASTIVWWGPTDRLETYAQANARIHRPGQTRRTLIVRLASTKIVREIYQRLEEKQSLQGVVLKLAEEDR